MVGVILGLAVGFIIIFVYVIQRKTIKTKKDVRQELNLETLAVIPKITPKKRSTTLSQKLTITSQNINATFSESFRIMRNVFLASLENDEKIVMTTSSVPGEGKTTVVTNLALSLSENGKKVLLVDADIRNPSVLELLEVNEDAIDFEVEPDLYKRAFIDKYNIDFMVPLSTKDEKLFSRRIKQIFDAMKKEYDYILVDTPPTGLISDAMYISQACDVVLYVVSQDVVKVSRIRSNIDNLMSTDIRILGCVLNGATSGFGSYGYGYSGYGYGGYGYGSYGYGYGKKKSKKH
jgi:Mrp family chromosome partitioning ATPase